MNTNEFNKRFGRRLMCYLERSGMMQKDLSNHLNINKSSVNAWCKGLKAPRPSKIDEICKFLNITQAHLMGTDEEVAKLENQIDESNVLMKFNTLSLEQQKQVINYIEFLFQQQKDK